MVRYEPVNPEYNKFLASLPTEEHKKLFELCYLLYEGSPAKMIGDFENRKAGRPYIYALTFAPIDDLLETSKDLKRRIDTYNKKNSGETLTPNIIKVDFKPKDYNQDLEQITAA